MNFKHLSYIHASECFFNSLLREVQTHTYNSGDSTINLKLSESESLILPTKYFSKIGRHTFTGEFFLEKNHNGKIEKTPVDFSQAVDVVLEDLKEKYQSNLEKLSLFKQRVKESTRYIEESLSARAEELEVLYTKSVINFKEAEQALIIGHNFHPHPKIRDGFNVEDFKSYSPEMKGEFHLAWFLVKEEIFYTEKSNKLKSLEWSNELLLKDSDNHPMVEEFLSKGYRAFPVHPYQRVKLLELSDIKESIAQNKIIDLSLEIKFHDLWSATSSTRALYNQSCPYMLKFSMSVRLTNSIRHILPHEAQRGLQVSDVFKTEKGQIFSSAHPSFEVLYEPAFIALKGLDGKILEESVVLLRENPFVNEAGDNVLLVAALTQKNPLNPLSAKTLLDNYLESFAQLKKISLTEASKIWFESFLKVAVMPLIEAQAQIGIYLGSHQQNMLLKLENGLPIKSYFRDCGGVGYAKLGKENFSGEVATITAENGNILENDYANKLFSYYVVINSVFNIIATIAQNKSISEEVLLAMFKASLVSLKDKGVSDATCIDYLVESDVLMQKGNFLCSFINLNENTTENPLGIYNPIPNFIKGDKHA